MAKPEVDYDPNPIPWVIPRHADRTQRGPGTAGITLTVTARDANTHAPVPGMVTSIHAPDPDGLIDDPNDLSFTTNRPNIITLTQVTSHEVPHGHRPLYLAPAVRVTARGYDNFDLKLT